MNSENSKRAVLVGLSDSSRKVLMTILKDRDYVVDIVRTAKEGLSACASRKPEIIICAPVFDDMNPEDFIQALRAWSNAAILVVGESNHLFDAPQAEAEIIYAGADDFITAPFHLSVMDARITAILRRSVTRQSGAPEIAYGPISMDLIKYQVKIDGKPISFTRKEFDLLRFFVIGKESVHTHAAILKAVWGPANVDNTQYLRVYIGQIRRKLDVLPGLGDALISRGGVGYILDLASYTDKRGEQVREEQNA